MDISLLWFLHHSVVAFSDRIDQKVSDCSSSYKRNRRFIFRNPCYNCLDFYHLKFETLENIQNGGLCGFLVTCRID